MSGRLAAILLPTLLQGGTEEQTLALAKVLRGAGWEVRLCCYHENDAAMVERFQQAGCAVTLLGMRREEGLPALFGRLRALLRAWRPSVAHVQYVAPGLVPVIAARAAGVRRLFATVHQPGGRFGRRERTLLKLAAQLTTGFFCVSRAVEASWFGASRVFDPGARGPIPRHATIYNAVDAGEIARRAAAADREGIRSGLGIAPADRVVGVVGRLRREKGQGRLIAALPALGAHVPEALLLLVGEGPDAAALREEAARLGVAGRVRWAGGRPHDEVAGLFAAMEVQAAPSRFEGFGLAAAEGMAAGLPVVAAAVDGLAEVVADGSTGFLVAGDGEAGFVAPLARLLRDEGEARRMGEAGRRRVAELFSPARYREAILAAYDGAARGGAAGGAPAGA